MNRLSVLDGGIFTTVQDLGRKGMRCYGIPVSGALDRGSARLANRLAGNEEEAPVLEMTLKGGSYEFSDTSVIAVTGADMKPTLDGKPVEMNRALKVSGGQKLQLDFARAGCRAYLAVAGRWKLKKVFGSYATYTMADFGGYKGRALEKGDVLQIENHNTPQKQEIKVPDEQINYDSPGREIRIIEGPEWNRLSEDEQKRFLNNTFTLGSQSNRMGFRLEGVQIRAGDHEIVSSAVVPGTVQLPNSGNPIVLMHDAQTTGGYLRLAKVIDADLGRLAQVRPGEEIRFKKIRLKDALTKNPA